MPQGRIRSYEVLFAIRDAAVVFAPRHLGRIGAEVRAGNVVVNADLGPADVEKKLSAWLVLAS